ncbi:hypothetical protein MTR67_043687 [Solanum verrucosum]|uniref:Integrase zinc-binding domain-containing protein n=1 Tax=Solanum verrucosum TaxID=315347 RepID=A0AAF0ZS93_SOLVR|nr:hypothetical protein MTR67_043667 [Solanum verrucosum]WMV50302.1 hypothetical protein MTR67_043687 [Solanum verrucosum]
MWLELLKDYNMSILYHHRKVNVVADALSRFLMSSVADVEDDKKEFVCDVHSLVQLGVWWLILKKVKHDLGPVLVYLKNSVSENIVKAFSQKRDGVLSYEGRLCVRNVDELRNQILPEAHSSGYSIHLGDAKMYHDMREVYWWNRIKKDISEFVAKCLNCQQVKFEHQKLQSLS